jgi:hypothetical protein
MHDPESNIRETDDEDDIVNELGISKDGLPEQSLLEKEADMESPEMSVLRALVLSMARKKMQVTEETLGAYVEECEPEMLDAVTTKMLRNVIEEYGLGLIVP